MYNASVKRERPWLLAAVFPLAFALYLGGWYTLTLLTDRFSAIEVATALLLGAVILWLLFWSIAAAFRSSSAKGRVVLFAALVFMAAMAFLALNPSWGTG